VQNESQKTKSKNKPQPVFQRWQCVGLVLFRLRTPIAMGSNSTSQGTIIDSAKKESAGWIIVTPATISKIAMPRYWEVGEGGTQTPVTYATQREAWKQIVENQISDLYEFIENEHLAEDAVPKFQPDDLVCPCIVNPNGSITTDSHGLLFNGVPADWDVDGDAEQAAKWLSSTWNTGDVVISSKEFSRDFIQRILGVDPDFLYATEGTDLNSFLGEGETETDLIDNARRRYGLGSDFKGAFLPLFDLLRKIYELKTGTSADSVSNSWLSPAYRKDTI
jgi:hypothetical protein